MSQNKTVLITGSNRGIGNAILEKFASEGLNVIAHSRQKSDEFEIYLDKLKKKYNINVSPIYFDLTNTNEMTDAIKILFKNKIKIDILVNSAGRAHGGFFQMTPVSNIRDIFDINLFAQMELTQLILKIMTRQKSGSIINIASIAGIDLKAGNCAYGVSKAALIAWTKTLAVETAKSNIRVNAVAPGLTNTRMAEQMEDKAGKEMVAASSMNRLAHPEEIANAVLFLASDNASFINGQVIRVDGGMV